MKWIVVALLFFGAQLSATITLIPPTAPNIISSTSGDETDQNGNTVPQVAVNRSGAAVAVWENLTLNSQGVNTIEAAVFSPTTGTWSSTFDIGFGTAPQVGIDDVGNAIAIWVNQPEGAFAVVGILGTLQPQLQVSHYSAATGTWSSSNPTVFTFGTPARTIFTISPTENSQIITPQIAVAPSGNALAVWVTTLTISEPSQVLALEYIASTNTWGSASRFFLPTQVSVISGALPQVGIGIINGIDTATVVWANTITNIIGTIEINARQIQITAP